MCDDCEQVQVSRPVSRRSLLWTPPAVAAASLAPLVDPEAAVAAERRIERICRAAWGAQPPSGAFDRHQITRVTVHHSGVAFRDNTKAPQTIRAMQADHQARGWPDIAYHLLVDRHGNVYRGRPQWAVGDTNTSYDPFGHLLVMCIGNFEVQNLPDRQLDATVNVLAWACARFGIRPRAIAGHRDFAATACPGDHLYRYLANGTIRRRVARRLGSVRLVDLCGRAGRRRVRQVENGTA